MSTIDQTARPDPSSLTSDKSSSLRVIHLNWVTPAKGFGILLVIAYHSTGVTGLPNYFQGQIGVDVFLILSGLGLTLNLRDESPVSFLRRRLEAIAPLYWMTLILYLAASRFLLGSQFRTVDIWSHVGLLHAFDDRTFFAIDNAWWFVGAIAILYVEFLFVRPLIRNGDVNAIFAIAIGSSLAVELLIQLVGPLPAGNSPIYTHFASRIVSFFLGVILAIVLQKKAKLDTHTVPAAILGVIYIAHSLEFGMGNPYTTLLGICYFYLTYLICVSAKGTLLSALSWIGTFSYPIYLIHDPLLTTVNRAILAPAISSRFAIGEISALRLGTIIAIVLTFIIAWLVAKVPFTTFLQRTNKLREGSGILMLFLFTCSAVLLLSLR